MPRMSTTNELTVTLERHRGSFESVIPFDLRSGELTVFDFTSANRDLERVGIHDATAFTEYLFEQIVEKDLPVGVGRYNEDRVLYRHSPLFDSSAERRSVHLGIDLFVPGGTPIHAPLDAVVHSFGDNDRLGDYGPTIILSHELEGMRFHTLYGHLGRTSLEEISPFQSVSAGEPFAEVGEHQENGGWPPHLHFQIVADMMGLEGDFPGVAAPSERDRYLALCPDPNLILGIPGL
jgi:hypothetical protein